MQQTMETVATGATTFSLSRFVEDVATLPPDGAGVRRVERFPDGRTMLVFRALADGTGDVSVAGPRTHAHFKAASGFDRVVVLRFKPGWSTSLLGVAANELTDRIVSLQDLWGRAGDLAPELLDMTSTREVLDRLTRAIAVRSRTIVEPAAALLARRAVRAFEGGEVRIDRVAAQLGVTTRHLRRAFTESIGIGPKDFVRTVRLQRAVRMSETSSDWVRIAAEAGYYDQAHLIADFRELVGLTPGAFARRARPSGSQPASLRPCG